MANPLVEIKNFGQSIWYDNIRRKLLTGGDLKRMIDGDGLMGVTSNPAIFEKAIAGSSDYDEALKALESSQDLDAKTLYEQLAVSDIQQAADILRPVYNATKARDGYVSLEVSPYLAHDTDGTLEEARRLWAAVDRPNVMIKVPATPEGVPAVKQLISEGINVNVTLLFLQSVYETVAEAFISGLEVRAGRGQPVDAIASVASFFISRIDTSIDALIDAKLKTSRSASDRALLRSIAGKAAIANAKLTYQRSKEIYGADRWNALHAKGAMPQRLLWASTSTKNPAYRDVVYVEELIGAGTVDTVPAATFDAFRDHGRARPSLEEHLDEAHDTMDTLDQLGIKMGAIGQQLLDDGVKLFADAFDKLLAAVETKREAMLGRTLDRQSLGLAADLDKAVKATLEDWRAGGKIRRLWAGDATLWTGADEGHWLGWLGVAQDQIAHAEPLRRLAADIQEGGFSHALLLGMGGSSLCPIVLAQTFGEQETFPTLRVLDSTVPAQVQAALDGVDLKNTCFIVSSKSGSTTEPNVFKQFFFEKVQEAVGAKRAGQRFLAITDPGSKLEHVATADKFRHVVHGIPSIGGRYSALSNFGMVPAAVMGLDVAKFLDRTEEMVHTCAACVPASENPGVILGATLGTLARGGRDKVTFIASPPIGALGAWLEQLLAESTGKQGKGLIPVDGEPMGAPGDYGADRLFVYLRYEPHAQAEQDASVAALEKAGHPVVRINLADCYDLGQEFFRWEIATAVAGSILGINAFDQPDVEASKQKTRALTSAYEQSGALPEEPPILTDEGVRLYSDATNADVLSSSAKAKTLDGYVAAHLARLGAGDYLALTAYVAMTPEHDAHFAAIRKSAMARRKVATCLGYGPRFLHSTGQAYKGGPNTGVFLQITSDDAADLPIPGQKYTFGVLKAAQAAGDFAVLCERKRRALRIHLGKDVAAGLALIRKSIDKALAS